MARSLFAASRSLVVVFLVLPFLLLPTVGFACGGASVASTSIVSTTTTYGQTAIPSATTTATAGTTSTSMVPSTTTTEATTTTGTAAPPSSEQAKALQTRLAKSVVSVSFNGQGESAVVSGLVYSPDGEIITRSAKVSGGAPRSISVGLPSGTTVSATVIAEDAASGLALLKTKTAGLTPVSFPSGPAHQGDWALSITRTGSKVISETGQVMLVGASTSSQGDPMSSASLEVSVGSLMRPGPVVFDANGNLLGLAVASIMGSGDLMVIPADTIATVASKLIAK